MGKCKYSKICDGYRKKSRTCNKSDGFYLNKDKPCRLYREFESKKSEKITFHATPINLNLHTTRSIKYFLMKLFRWFSSHRTSSPHPFGNIRERVVPLTININKKEVSN